jgi:hypothetical protein
MPSMKHKPSANCHANGDSSLIRLADDLRRCLEKWDAARRERHEQQVRCGISGSEDALRREWDALGECGACRHALAQTGALLLRLALDEFPAAMRTMLREALEGRP